MLKSLRRLLPLTREGFVFLLGNAGLLVTGLYKGINLINLLTCSMLCLLGLNVLLAGRQIRGLRGRRLLYDPVFANTPFKLRIEVHNQAKKKRTGIVIQDAALEGAARWYVNEIGPGETRELEHEIIVAHRGSVVRGPLKAVSGFPFGLAQRRTVLSNKERVLVLPQVHNLHAGVMRRLLSPIHSLVSDESSQTVRHAAAQSEIHSLREYRPGDSPRWIHWRTSARRDALFVREYEDIPTEQLTLLVDPWLSPDAPAEAAHRLLESTIEMAASIVAEWCRQTGNPFYFAIAGRDAEVFSGATSREFALRILERLAMETGYTHADHEPLLRHLASQRLSRGRILVICTAAGALAARIRDELRSPLTCISVTDEDLSDYWEEGVHELVPGKGK